MPISSPNDSVLVAKDGAVCTLTLNRPQSLNALNVEMLVALAHVIPAVARDDSVRCLVIRGEGENFMAGGDIAAFKEWVDQTPDAETRRQMFQGFVTELQPMIMAIRETPKPVIAAVRGAAAGFGMSLVMVCDLAIAAEGSVFSLAYNQIGLSPDGGASYMLPRMVGLKHAFEIAMFGDRMNADAAVRAGLINMVVPADKLDASVAALAAQLAEGAVESLARTKALLNRSLSSTLEDQLAAEAESFGACAATGDFAEGVTAFMEKRAPKFSGS